MVENPITIEGAGPYFPAWKSEFTDILRSKTLGTVTQSGDQVVVAGPRFGCELNLERDNDDVLIHVFPSQFQNHRSGGATAVCCLLALIFLFFGGWMFWSLTLVCLLIVVAILVGTSFSRGNPNLVGVISALAKAAWQRVQIDIEYAQKGTPAGKAVQVPNTRAKIPPSKPLQPPESYRLPDEDYLLSPQAAKIAATPASPARNVLRGDQPTPTYCPYCGERRQTGANFCAKCGAALNG
jgi:hypothetical protein